MECNLQKMFDWAAKKNKITLNPRFQINIGAGKQVIFNLFKVSRRVGWMKPLSSAHWSMTTIEVAFLIEPNIPRPTPTNLPCCRHRHRHPPPPPREWN